MSHECNFTNFEISLLADATFISNLILYTTQKDCKCLKIAKCSNSIPKYKFINRKGRIYATYFWLSGVVIVKDFYQGFEAC